MNISEKLMIISDLVENPRKCPFCGKELTVDEFEDDLSLKEATISGLCQACQDTIWER